MKRDNILARLFRALSGQSQSQLAEEIGVHPSLVGQWEMGQATPSAEHLRRVAETAGLTVGHGEVILDHVETLRRRNLRRGEEVEDLFDNLADEMRSIAEAAYRQLLTLPLSEEDPEP